jgi:aspartate oxidase
VLTGDAQRAIHWLEELGVEFTRENGGYRLARCGGASRKRLLAGRRPHRHAIPSSLRGCVGGRRRTSLINAPWPRPRAG